MRDEGGTDKNSAMMSAISEAWEIMTKQMHMRYDDVGKVFEKWTSSGELVSPRSL
jgi:6-phosphogluconate dehydrogenase